MSSLYSSRVRSGRVIIFKTNRSYNNYRPNVRIDITCKTNLCHQFVKKKPNFYQYDTRVFSTLNIKKKN